MKRIFSVLLALVMVFCASAAFAESSSPYGRVSVMSGQVMPFESATGLFAMDIPSDYFVLNSDVFQSITEAMLSMDADEFYNTFGFSMESAQSLLNNISLETLASCELISAPDLSANVNVIATVGTGINQESLQLYSDALAQQMTEQYIGMGIPEENCVNLGLVTYGSNVFMGFSVELLAGMPTYQYMTANANGDMLVITFTAMTEDVIVPILESMIVY